MLPSYLCDIYLDIALCIQYPYINCAARDFTVGMQNGKGVRKHAGRKCVKKWALLIP
jgi:hypothetical protein